MKTGLIIGTGCQSEAVVNLVSSSGQCHLLSPARNVNSPGAMKLQALPNVELIANVTNNGYNITTFLAGGPKIGLCLRQYERLRS